MGESPLCLNGALNNAFAGKNFHGKEFCRRELSREKVFAGESFRKKANMRRVQGEYNENQQHFSDSKMCNH